VRLSPYAHTPGKLPQKGATISNATRTCTAYSFDFHLIVCYKIVYEWTKRKEKYPVMMSGYSAGQEKERDE